MKKKTTLLPTVEELMGPVDEPPLKLELVCNSCQKKTKREFRFAVVNPDKSKYQEDGWDGILLSDIFECPRCGAVDDYQLGALSYMTLTVDVIKTMIAHKTESNKERSSRIVYGVSELFDGTITKRPSQAIAHLRDLIEKEPENSEAWRRFGNALERFGKLSDAETAWRKALALDPNDIEVVYSLARFSADCDKWVDAGTFISRGIELLPKTKKLHPDERMKWSGAIVYLLEESLEVSDDPLALTASWQLGSNENTMNMTVSSVDLRKVDDFDRLAEFLVQEDIMFASLVPELPEETPTILECRLNGRRRFQSDINEPHFCEPRINTTPIVNPMRHVGRNDPCPCGSNKKYKKCCGSNR